MVNNQTGKHFLYTEAGENKVKTKLERIAEISRNNEDEIFNNIIHLINPELLKQCHREMANNKATGIDKVDKKKYEENLEGNIADLWDRLKKFSYKPQPIRRTYIPKAGSDKKRPLGIERKLCPYCTGEKAIPGVNSLKAVYPELIKNEWSILPNILLEDSDQILPNNSQSFFWICPKCNKTYTLSAKKRVQYLLRKRESCPYCKGLRPKFITY